jgi:hypothetical protein
MTLDEVIVAVCTAVQPHVDRDEANPREVSVMVAEMKKIFVEEPNMEAAFIAAVQAIAWEARRGWRP